MAFRDTLVTCQECGKSFVFTVEKQRQLADQGASAAPPDLCEACTQRVRYGGRLHGRVKWFSQEKGYGFLVEDGGREVFFHRDGLLAAGGEAPTSLPDGQEVLYELMDTSRGPQAIRVQGYQA